MVTAEALRREGHAEVEKRFGKVSDGIGEQ